MRPIVMPGTNSAWGTRCVARIVPPCTGVESSPRASLPTPAAARVADVEAGLHKTPSCHSICHRIVSFLFCFAIRARVAGSPL